MMGFRPQGGLTEGIIALVAVLLLVVTNVGFGLITASISKSSSAATGIGFIFILPQMLLGSFIPAPDSAARLVPSYYVSDSLTSLFLRGAIAGSVPVLNNLIILTVYTLTVVSIGVIISSRYLRR